MEHYLLLMCSTG